MCGTARMTSASTPGFDPDNLADQLYRHFGPGTEYAAARQQAEEKKFGKQTDFTSKSLSAVQGPWTNHCLKTFLALREAGVKPSTDGYSLDPDGIVKSIAVVALLSGKPKEMLDAVEKCVRVAQVRTSEPCSQNLSVFTGKIWKGAWQQGYVFLPMVKLQVCIGLMPDPCFMSDFFAGSENQLP